MLSISALTSAKQAGGYYEKDNYYAKDSAEAVDASNWTGKGAAALGLSGAVGKEQFQTLLEGKMPNGQELGRRMEDGSIKHLPGYDLTFSAPKSVSILALVGGDKRLIQAHKEAMQANLTRIEAQLAKTRVSEDDMVVHQDTGNHVIAQFHHDTSRELEPHLHGHNVILNMTQREDGKWGSIVGSVFYEHKMLNGLIYRADLAMKSLKLGYELEVDHQKGIFEIKAVPQALNKAFSTRREQIEQDLKEKGLEGAKAAEQSTLATRVAKRDVDREQLKEQWGQQAKALGFDAAGAVLQSYSASKNDYSNASLRDNAQEAVNFSIKHLSEREAVFSMQDILKEALKAGMGKTLFPEIQTAFKHAKTNGLLIEAGAGRYTTHQAIEIERSIIQQMVAGKNTVSPIAKTSFWKLLTAPFSKQPTVEQFLTENYSSFKPGQKAAAEMILTTQDRITGIQGFAGTGKTRMLEAVREYAELQGYQVRGFAPKGSAANELEKGAGIASSTLSDYLVRMEKTLNIKGQTKPADKRELLVVDESSMTSNQQLHTFLSILKKTDAQAVFVGDDFQLGGSEAGKPFGLLQKAGMRTITMKDIIRQENAQLLAAVHNSINGKIQAAMEKLEGSIHEIPNKNARLNALVGTYLKLSPAERKDTLVLSPANTDRVAINALIREGLKKENQLMGPENTSSVLVNKSLGHAQRNDAKYYIQGDIIRTNRSIDISADNKSVNRESNPVILQKGVYYTVKAKDSEKNMLTLSDDQGNTLQWQPGKGDAKKSGAIEVYQAEQRGLMTGDTIRWTRNNKGQGIRNSEAAEVKAIQDGKAFLQLENGKILNINLSDKNNQHWDHGYAATVHAAQGKTCGQVLAHIESTSKNLTHQRAFYVEVSRAKFEAQFFTDSKENLVKTLEKYTGAKTSALEFTNPFEISAHKERQVSKGVEMDF